MRVAATLLVLISWVSFGSQLPGWDVGIDARVVQGQRVDTWPAEGLRLWSSRPAAATPPVFQFQVEQSSESLEGPASLALERETPQGAEASNRQRFAAEATSMDLIHMGVALAFALIHALLFAFFRREQGNLYFALFALAFAGMTWGGYRLDHPEVGLLPAQLVGTLRLTFTCGIAQAFALQRFAHVVFLLPTPRVFYPLLAWGLGLISWIWIVPLEVLSIRPVMYLALATTLELLRTVVVAVRQPKRPGNWLIFAGLTALAGSGALQSLLALGILGPFDRMVYSYGVLLFLLAVSIYLSRRFATTSLALEHQLAEVKRLSEKTLEQERQARRVEVERRLLEAENERRAHELEEARRLQLSMLPGLPPILPGVEVAARMLTATEVGGDYYDFQVGEDGTLTLAVGDATGHGLNAGIMVASTKSLFQALEPRVGLAECMRKIDRGLRGMKLRRMGMSLSLARYQPGTLSVAAAGMPPALVYRRSTGQVEEFAFSAPPLGTLNERPFPERSMDLAKGDAVLLATDGLVELLDPDDEAWGYTPVAEAFRVAASQGAEEAVEDLLGKARQWSRKRPLGDDLTLVVLRAS